MSQGRTRAVTAGGMMLALLLLVTLITGCLPSPASDVEELVLQDSAYLDAETLKPFSGRVFKSFANEPSAIQLSGRLRDGRWNGEMTVFYESGRIRYQGRLVDGERCGAWIEERDEAQPGSVLEQLTQEIESLAMYPECTEG